MNTGKVIKDSEPEKAIFWKTVFGERSYRFQATAVLNVWSMNSEYFLIKWQIILPLVSSYSPYRCS